MSGSKRPMTYEEAETLLDLYRQEKRAGRIARAWEWISQLLDRVPRIAFHIPAVYDKALSSKAEWVRSIEVRKDFENSVGVPYGTPRKTIGSPWLN